MATIKEKWEALVEAIESTDAFEQVEPVPFKRTQSAKFLKSLPALKLPACLVIWMGADDDALGAHLDRIDKWSFMVVAKDVSGDAWETGCDLIDGLRDDVLDQQIMDDDELTIHASCSVRTADAGNDSIFVAEIAVTTREAKERE